MVSIEKEIAGLPVQAIEDYAVEITGGGAALTGLRARTVAVGRAIELYLRQDNGEALVGGVLAEQESMIDTFAAMAEIIAATQTPANAAAIATVCNTFATDLKAQMV